jgi:hypothetical protein
VRGRDSHQRRFVSQEEARPVSPRLNRFARRAGTIALALIMLDLVATAATAAIGWELFKR